MGNVFHCITAKSDLPEVKVTIKAKCCNKHTMVFQIKEDQIKDLLETNEKFKYIEPLTTNL